MDALLMTIRKLSKTGLFFSVFYIFTSCIYVTSALNTTEPKGSIVSLQIPLLVQTAILDETGYSEIYRNWSWPKAYMYLATPMVFLLYIIGSLIGKSSKALIKVLFPEEPNDIKKKEL